MNKKTKVIINLGLLLLVGVLMLTGCGNKETKIETEKLTQEQSKYTLSVKVPKEKGYQFVEKLEEKNEHAMNYPDYILDGEKVQIFFENTSYLYQTSTILRKKYPEMDTANPNFDDFLKYNDKGYTEDNVVNLNGRRAIKIDNKYGPAGNTILVGYNYFVEMKDSPKYIYMMVFPKNEGEDIKSLVEDPEVKVILDSITFTDK